jgi:hypothetical protein
MNHRICFPAGPVPVVDTVRTGRIPGEGGRSLSLESVDQRLLMSAEIGQLQFSRNAALVDD